MIEHKEQGIQTNYEIGDVFKPFNASQLTRAIHYDFVITQEMFNNFVQYNSIPTEASDPGASVDMGEVICSQASGSRGPTPADLRKPCVINVYIAADTQGYVLNFSSRFLYDLLGFSIKTWTIHTADRANIYSAHPYSIKYIVPGVNFWSDITSVVKIKQQVYDNPGYGICRIGSFLWNDGIGIDFGTNTNVQLVLGANHPYENKWVPQTPAAGQLHADYIAPLVYANWMSSGSSISKYYLYKKDAVNGAPGLYHSIQWGMNHYSQTVEIAIYADDHCTFGLYHLASYQLRNCFKLALAGTAPDGFENTMYIYMDGTIKFANEGVGGGSSKVTIFDFHKPNGATSKWDDLINYSIAEVANGETTVKTKFYGMGPDYDRFDFKGTQILDWNTWATCTSASGTNGIYNDNYTLPIDSTKLQENIIYEINLYVWTWGCFYGGGFTGSSSGGVSIIDGSTFYIGFTSNGTAYDNCCGWSPIPDGAPTSYKYSPVAIRPTRYLDEVNDVNIDGRRTARITATGKIFFTKLNGKIHILVY